MTYAKYSYEFLRSGRKNREASDNNQNHPLTLSLSPEGRGNLFSSPLSGERRKVRGQLPIILKIVLSERILFF